MLMSSSVDFEKLPPKVQSAVAELERSTAECTGFLVNICLSYGSRAEIVMACNSAIDEGERERERRSKRGITEQPGCTSESMLDGELSDAQHLNGAINQNRSIVKGCTCRNTIDLHDTGELNASDHVHVAAVDSDVTGCNNKDKKSNSRNGKDLDSKLDLCDRNHHMNGSGNDSWGFSTNSGNSSSSSSVKNSRHQSTSSPCSSGGMDDESKDTLLPKSSSFQLDEATLSRHMCTAGIPG